MYIGIEKQGDTPPFREDVVKALANTFLEASLSVAGEQNGKKVKVDLIAKKTALVFNQLTNDPELSNYEQDLILATALRTMAGAKASTFMDTDTARNMPGGPLTEMESTLAYISGLASLASTMVIREASSSTAVPFQSFRKIMNRTKMPQEIESIDDMPDLKPLSYND